MAIYAQLQRLYCQRNEDTTGNDEAYFRFNGKKVWGPVDIDDNKSIELDDVLHKVNGQMIVELFDEDLGVWWDKDDFLGKHVISEDEVGLGDRNARFTKDGANYTLYYAVINV